MDILIVPLDQSRCDDVAVLEEICFGTDAWPCEAFTELLGTYRDSPDFRGQVWVALQEPSRELVGYVALEVSSLGEAELTNLAVAPASRQQGVGRLLTAFVASVCRERGINLLWLRVRKSNTQAVKFYESCAFAIRGEFRDYYEEPSEDALILARDLAEEGDGEGSTK